MWSGGGPALVSDVVGEVIGPSFLGRGASLGAGSRVEGSVVSSGASVGAGAVVAGSVLLAGAVVGQDAEVRDAVVGEESKDVL